MMLHISLHWKGQNIDPRLNEQKTFHISGELWVVFYEDFFKENWLHCKGTAVLYWI